MNIHNLTCQTRINPREENEHLLGDFIYNVEKLMFNLLTFLPVDMGINVQKKIHLTSDISNSCQTIRTASYASTGFTSGEKAELGRES